MTKLMLKADIIQSYFSQLNKDFRIIVDGNDYYVNRHSLKHFCSFFKSLFTSSPDLSEYQMKMNVSKGLFESVIDYINGKNIEYEQSQLFELYSIVSQFGIVSLHNIIYKNVLNCINLENFQQYFEKFAHFETYCLPLVDFIYANPDFFQKRMFNAPCPIQMIKEILNYPNPIFKDQDQALIFLLGQINYPSFDFLVFSYLKLNNLSLSGLNRIHYHPKSDLILAQISSSDVFLLHYSIINEKKNKLYELKCEASILIDTLKEQMSQFDSLNNVLISKNMEFNALEAKFLLVIKLLNQVTDFLTLFKDSVRNELNPKKEILDFCEDASLLSDILSNLMQYTKYFKESGGSFFFYETAPSMLKLAEQAHTATGYLLMRINGYSETSKVTDVYEEINNVKNVINTLFEPGMIILSPEAEKF